MEEEPLRVENVPVRTGVASDSGKIGEIGPGVAVEREVVGDEHRGVESEVLGGVRQVGHGRIVELLLREQRSWRELGVVEVLDKVRMRRRGRGAVAAGAFFNNRGGCSVGPSLAVGTGQALLGACTARRVAVAAGLAGAADVAGFGGPRSRQLNVLVVELEMSTQNIPGNKLAPGPKPSLDRRITCGKTSARSSCMSIWAPWCAVGRADSGAPCGGMPTRSRGTRSGRRPADHRRRPCVVLLAVRGS